MQSKFTKSHTFWRLSGQRTGARYPTGGGIRHTAASSGAGQCRSPSNRRGSAQGTSSTATPGHTLSNGTGPPASTAETTRIRRRVSDPAAAESARRPEAARGSPRTRVKKSKTARMGAGRPWRDRGGAAADLRRRKSACRLRGGP